MPTTSDEVLIARIAKGDRLAMEELYGRYRVPVYRFVLRMVRNPTTAEDLNSDVFLDVWRQAGTFEGRSAVSTWIFSIARFKALNALQRRPTEELDDEKAGAIEDQADDPEIALAKKDKAAVLRACLLKLIGGAPRDRQPCLLPAQVRGRRCRNCRHPGGDREDANVLCAQEIIRAPHRARH